ASAPPLKATITRQSPSPAKAEAARPRRSAEANAGGGRFTKSPCWRGSARGANERTAPREFDGNYGPSSGARMPRRGMRRGFRVAIVTSQFERIEVHAKHLDATATTTTDPLTGVSTTTRPAYDVWLAKDGNSADYGAMHVNHHGNAAFVFDTRHTAQPNLDGT